MIILGIDPGTKRLGYAIINKKSASKIELLDSGLISPQTKDQNKTLHEIWKEINNLIEKWRPEVIAVEKLFFSKNQKTALSVAEARGVILLTSSIHNCALLEFAPNEIKSTICGYGHASKSQILNIVLKTLKIEKIPGPDDVSDAVAIALTGAFHIRLPKS